jgi:hypothetical protein
MPRGPKTGEGNFGDIPDDIILARYERTDIRDDPEMLDYHQRSILRDNTPDRPFMASDEPFNGGFDPRTGMERQGGSFSKSQLSLRGIGRRSWIEPNLPDGTFLDWHGLEKDPRSIRPDPDFQNLARQSEFRGRYVKYFPDSDMSVPETGMNTYQRNESIRESQRWVADKMKYFDTAKDNWTNKRLGQTIPTIHRAVQTTVDGEIVNLSDATTFSKSNLTDLLTNQYRVGWRRTTDQDFRVAKYGQVRPTMGVGNQKWFKNMRMGEDTRVDLGLFQDQIIPKTLVQTFENIIRARGVKQQLTEGLPWQSSYGLKNYKDPMVEANYRGGSVGFQSVEDRATEIVRLLQDAYVQRKDAMLSMPDKPDSRVGMSWIEPKIVQYMELSNRKIGPLDVEMILKDAAQLSKALGYHITDAEMRVKVPFLPSDFKPTELSWKSDDNRHKDDSRVVANYININPITPQPLQELINGEDYKARIDKSLHYSNVPPPDMPHSLIGGYLDYDQEYAIDRQAFGTGYAPMSERNTRRHMNTTHMENMEENMVNDADNRKY